MQTTKPDMRNRNTFVYVFTPGAVALTIFLWTINPNFFSWLAIITIVGALLSLALCIDAGMKEFWDRQRIAGNWAIAFAALTLAITLFSPLFAGYTSDTPDSRTVITHTPTARPSPNGTDSSTYQNDQPQTWSTYDWQSHTDQPPPAYEGTPEVTVIPAPTTTAPPRTTVPRTTTPRTTPPNTEPSEPPDVFSETEQEAPNPPGDQGSINPSGQYSGPFSQPGG